MPQAASLHLQSPLQELPMLSAAAKGMLTREGILTLGELLMQHPSRHEDRRRTAFGSFAPGPTPVCHQVRILSTRLLRVGGRGGIFEAVARPAGDGPWQQQQLVLRWFRMPFLQRALAVGMDLMVYGKIKEIKDRLIMDHPDYEVVSMEDETPGAPRIHSGRLVPVYRLRAGLKQKPLRAAIWQVLQHLDHVDIPDILPAPRHQGEFAGLNRARAWRMLHQPETFAELESARRYLALEEFYLLQLRMLHRRRQLKDSGGLAQQSPGLFAAEFLQQLPFELTAAQRRSLEEIRQDMAAPMPMNRLLHGDVGSGKTVVALAAMLLAVEAGHQAALMAPTQILAEQHYQNALRWLEPLGIRVALRTADKKEDVTQPTLAFQAAPTALFEEPSPATQDAERNTQDAWAPPLPQVVIGTHALLYDDALLPNLGLAVIDEQHKFGVAQRSRLVSRGHGQHTPDVLVLTATPIPRTLTLTLYGDLDVSTLDERPRERGKIITAIRETTKLKDVTAFLQSELTNGRQCYLVYPLIEESDKRDAGDAVNGHEDWLKRLKPHAVALLHGRMDGETKDATMRRFRDGQIQALVSTTVIEVGVDVPNATVMVIHDAARFGLAQLHQLRGRIGRGPFASYCILMIDKNDSAAREKLAILEETTDGFRIAEEDLLRRGPGDVLGNAQSGQAPLHFHEVLADTRLLTLARRLAVRTLGQDPQLTLPNHSGLHAFVLETSAPVATLH